MKSTNKEKRERILDAATALFASRPFHKVLLSDVAAEASVGKGTLYLYFGSKDELYLSVLFRGFAELVDRVRERSENRTGTVRDQLEDIVREMIISLYDNTSTTELLRGAVVGCPSDGEWMEKRQELRFLLQSVIERGVAGGEFADANPELTAHYLPGIIRSVCLFKPEGVDKDAVCRHACEFVLKGLAPLRNAHR